MRFLKKVGRVCNTLIDGIFCLCLCCLLLYGLYSLWDIYKVYQNAGLSKELAQCKPDEEAPYEALQELMKINSDVCAWITIDDTGIDYPVVQGTDNTEYLNHDLYGEYLLSGSIFLDYRNDRNFTDSYSLLYGHHMNGGKMFGDLEKYKEEAFFSTHRSGMLYLPKQAYEIEIFAFIDTNAHDKLVFRPNQTTWENQGQLLDYTAEKALWRTEEYPQGGEKILGMSTCDSGNTDGRYVIFARIIDTVEGGKADVARQENEEDSSLASDD